MIRSIAMRSRVRASPAAATVLVVVALQLAAFRLSLLPQIAHR